MHDRMTGSTWSVIASLVRSEMGEMKNDIIGNVTNSVNSVGKQNGASEDDARARAEHEKRETAIRAYQEERRKKRERDEYAREKFRDTIRKKYGIERKPDGCYLPDDKTIQEVKKHYNMSEEEFQEFKDKVDSDTQQKRASIKRIDKKLETRQRKKELKKDIQDACKVQ